MRDLFADNLKKPPRKVSYAQERQSQSTQARSGHREEPIVSVRSAVSPTRNLLSASLHLAMRLSCVLELTGTSS